MANGDDRQESNKAMFNLSPKISHKAQAGNTYNDLNTDTLVSVGQLADDDCDTFFFKHAAYVLKKMAK